MESINSNTPGTQGKGAVVSVEETTPPVAVDIIAGNAKVSIGFTSTDSDAALIVDSGRVHTSMAGNAAYPKPLPTLADLAAARTTFIAAVEAAKGSRIGISARVEQRRSLVKLLRTLALYVQVASAGNQTVLLSSGFPVQRSHAPVGELAAPAGVRFKRGKVSGQAIARCRWMPQARAYQWRIANAATPNAWEPVITTFAANNVFTGLAPLNTYIVQVCALGRAGASDWSEAITVVVL